MSKCKLSYFKCDNSFFGTQFSRGGGGGIRISSDGDDRMGIKIKTPKNPQGFLQNPKKSHAEYQSILDSNNTRDTHDRLLFHQ